ncbi:autolysin [Enterococcus sp. BWM-S5]|uniref:Autolysin n=1 Tax=Enterococcus larvae TaxID=2794352 RepID=A0ABS4CF68_9ENTE|nr:ArpU family phage packaging/lysis transcriptional regulator [Enterococcus larvae]MBP1045284.1 autolysin [Enterococcus larvae]
MTLVPEIDKKQTRKNARSVLNQYRKWQRIAGRPSVDIKSPIITSMPKSDSINNRVEDALIERVSAEAERDAIVSALASLSVINRQILYYSFCDAEKRSVCWIGMALNYSDKNIEKMKAIALIEFAEAYKKGNLLAEK